jgi:hypothetical protein
MNESREYGDSARVLWGGINYHVRRRQDPWIEGLQE